MDAKLSDIFKGIQSSDPGLSDSQVWDSVRAELEINPDAEEENPRKVTMEIVKAFYEGRRKTVGNSATDGQIVTLHGNVIAERTDEGGIRFSDAGWRTTTTKERLNGLLEPFGVGVFQSKFQWYIQNFDTREIRVWDGEYIVGPEHVETAAA